MIRKSTYIVIFTYYFELMMLVVCENFFNKPTITIFTGLKHPSLNKYEFHSV